MRDAKINWCKIIWDIQKKGRLTVPRIAEKFQVSRTTVTRWRDQGREPTPYIKARKLLELWSEHTGSSPEDLPYI